LNYPAGETAEELANMGFAVVVPPAANTLVRWVNENAFAP